MRAVCCVMICVFAVSVIACGGGKPTESGGPSKPIAPATYKPMTADELGKEWAKNPAAAVERYKSNGVELSGILDSMSANGGGGATIDIRGSERGVERSCVFVSTEKAMDGLRKCEVGKPIVVKVRSEGLSQPRPWLVADEVRPGD